MSNYGMNYWGGYGFGSSGPGFDKRRIVVTDEEIDQLRRNRLSRWDEKKAKERLDARRELAGLNEEKVDDQTTKYLESVKAKIAVLKANGDPEHMLPIYEAELRELGKEVG